jgi:PAS domain S-box-containing protein
MFERTGNREPVAAVSPWLPSSDDHLLWAFLERAPVPLLVADDERRIVRVNEPWCEMVGYPEQQAVTMRIDDLLAPESRPGLEMRWSDLLGSGMATARIVLICADGNRLHVRYGAFAHVLPGLDVATFIAEPGQQAGRMMRPQRSRRAGQLTRREQESLRLVAMGMTTTTAADQLGISPETVRTHVRNAMNKLGAKTRAQAIAVAMRDGEIPG